MKISQLLEQHNSAGKSAAENNLGDAFLCRENRVYRDIREKCLQAGFELTSKQDDLYAALPLSQLNAILEAKTIPYQDNVSALKQIENKMPGVASWFDVQDNLKKNFLFHESCHAVARSMAFDLKQSPVLNMLMEESFSNTCELLGMIDAENSAHRIFYEWNSYSALFEERTNFKKSIESIGADVLAKFIFLGYLHSNFLFNQWDEKTFKRALILSGARELDAKALRSLSRICFTLDETFKKITTSFYMKLNGFKEISPELKGSYLQLLEKDTTYNNYFNKLLTGLL